MMFRQLHMVCAALAAFASLENSASAMVIIGSELKQVAQAEVPYHIDSLSPNTNLDRLFATHGRFARAFDLQLSGERDYELPVKAPCGKRGCRKEEKYRCVLHQTLLNLDGMEKDRLDENEGRRREVRFAPEAGDSEFEAARAFSKLTESHEDSEQGRFDRPKPFPGRFIDQYAVGCVSEGQQWGSILGHNLEKEVCHTESSSAAGRSMMITASDSRAGHFYYVKPSTKEVCAIRNYAECKKTGICQPHVCLRLHSDITCLGVIEGSRFVADIPERDEEEVFGAERIIRPLIMRPDLAVGLRNGQTVFLSNMRLVNEYTPDCNCVDCTPMPIAISHSPSNDLTYILYERCKGRNFLNAVSFLLTGTPLSKSIIPPQTVFSVRAPGVHFIACCSRSSTVYLTSHSGGAKYYLVAGAPNTAFLIARAAGQVVSGLNAFEIIAYAPIPGCPTSLVTDEKCAAYVATDKTMTHSDKGIRLVSADFYASFEVECRKFHISFSTSANLISKYIVAPVTGPKRNLEQ